MDMLVEVLNKMDDIHFIHASDKYFYNYDKMLNSLYKKFRAGTIQKNHYFVINCDLSTIMISKSYINDDTDTSYDFYKETPHREVLLLTYSLEELNAPGIREIKQVELWNVSIPLIALLKELYKEPRGGALDGPVCKSPATTDKRTGLRGEYENFLIPQTPSDIISTYLLAFHQGVSGRDENASQHYVSAAQLRSPS